MGFVPYVIPGFGLAKLAAGVFEAKPDVEGLILHKHGIFTFGADAREAYERMIAMVTRAEVRLAKVAASGVRGGGTAAGAGRPSREVAPIIRGAVAVRSSAAPAEPQAFLARIPWRPRSVELCQRRRVGATTPARRGYARSHYSHQKLPPDRVAGARRQARRLPARRARRRWPTMCAGTTPCSRARTHRVGGSKSEARSDAARGASTWTWACSASVPRQRMPPLPPTSPRTPSVSLPMPKPSAASNRSRKRSCSM